MILRRLDAQRRVETALLRSPVTAVLGPRQCGKTTLARHIAATQPHLWFDLEDPVDRRRLETPGLVLTPAEGLVVIDEIQRQPDLFPLLRVLADRTPPAAKFLILGSVAPELVRGASETLAGRVEFVELGGFSVADANNDFSGLWVRGGFPRSYLARSDIDSTAWRENFIRTFLERDLPQLGVRTAAQMMRRFWTMMAHYHGQIWNGAELARALGVSGHTIRHYLDTLTGTFMVRQLPPWFENIGKRVVKSPKMYIRDSGIVHTLLGIANTSQLEGHPKVGASWEGFALEEVLRNVPGEPYFWATHNGGEIDLVLMRRAERWGFEFKRSDAPGLTRSMQSGIADLQLNHLWVVYPGSQAYAIHDKVTVVPLSDLHKKSWR